LVFLAHCMSRSSLCPIFMWMSPHMRWIRRCARLRAVPPPNTSRSGAVSAAAIAARAWTTCQSFSTSVGLGKPKCAWISSRAWRDGLSLKDQLRIPVPELPRKTPFTPHDRIVRHLGRAAFVIGTLGFGRFPLHTELGERLARSADEAIRAVEDRLTGAL